MPATTVAAKFGGGNHFIELQASEDDSLWGHKISRSVKLALDQVLEASYCYRTVKWLC